jgi:hypothetical protein
MASARASYSSSWVRTSSPSTTLRCIREVERISDDDYLGLLRPYVEGKFGSDQASKRAFYELALARKYNRMASSMR